jgi:hypothetical protein
MINSIAYYRSYTFRPEERIRPSDITADLLLRRGPESVIVSSQASGTATVIHAENRRVVLLTCAHVVGFPDTSLAFHAGPDHRSTGFLRALAVKEKQTNYVAVFPEGGELEILAMDKTADVALLGKTFLTEPFPRIRPLAYPPGRARELEWGSFVYLFGYPSGYRMVTKGIVSSPNKDRRGAFLVDAVFNRGFSGGVALAIRDGVPNFELVGIVKLVSGRSAYVLAPALGDGAPDYDPTVPYTGNIYAERRIDIEYGIAQAVSIETILEFLGQHSRELAAGGYTVRFPMQSTVP